MPNSHLFPTAYRFLCHNVIRKVVVFQLPQFVLCWGGILPKQKKMSLSLSAGSLTSSHLRSNNLLELPAGQQSFRDTSRPYHFHLYRLVPRVDGSWRELILQSEVRQVDCCRLEIVHIERRMSGGTPHFFCDKTVDCNQQCLIKPFKSP